MQNFPHITLLAYVTTKLFFLKVYHIYNVNAVMQVPYKQITLLHIK